MDVAANLDVDMQVQSVAGSGDTANRLPQILDFTQAQALRDSMVTLARGGMPVLDAGAVERMSTPCAQILLAAGRAAVAAGAPFKILNASAAFQTAITDLGLQAEFRNWMV